MTTQTHCSRSTTLHNLAPFFWPLWLWGSAPGAYLGVILVLAADYVWNAFVLAGLLVLVGRAERVGQRGLLLGAVWMTTAGVAADALHTNVLSSLLARVDFLLVPEPLPILLSALQLPAAVIFLAALAMTLGAWRLGFADSLVLSATVAVLSAPWLSLLSPDFGGQALPPATIGGVLAVLAVGALGPWALVAAGAWAADQGISERSARTAVSVAAGVLIGLFGSEVLITSHPAPQTGLPGRICFAIRDRVYIQDGATGLRSLLTPDPVTPVAWSPNGERILMQRIVSATTSLAVLDARDGAATKLTTGTAHTGAWSPDSASLLFTTDRPLPQDDAIWRVEPGRQPVLIANGSSPSWSPDGRRIAFSSRGAGGRPQVVVMNPDGSDPIQLTTDGGEDPAWSPDGRYIAYAYNGKVYAMTAGGADRRLISTGDEIFDQNPILRWSPDGSRLAYAVLQPAGAPRPSAIYIASMAGGETLRLSGDYLAPLVWSPDGAWLAVVRDADVWALNLTAGEWRRVSPGAGFAWGGVRPAMGVQPAPTYAPTPTPTALPPAVVESPDVLAVNPKDTAILYAGTPQGVVRRTATGGWGSSSQGIAYPRRVRALAIDPSNPSILFAGTDGERGIQGGALYKSTDGGVRWVATGLVDVDVYAIAVDPLSPATVYAGTVKGVFKSTDSGATWRAASTGLKSAAVQALAIDPTPPGNQRITASAVLYAGTRQGDLHKTTDAGATWAALDSRDAPWTSVAVSPLRPTVVFAAGADGLLRSIDRGTKWEMVAGGIWRLKLDCVVVEPKDPAVVYAAGPSGIYKSTDGGENWGPASIGLGAARPTTLAIDPKDPAILYAGTDKGVFRSGNGGVYWER